MKTDTTRQLRELGIDKTTTQVADTAVGQELLAELDRHNIAVDELSRELKTLGSVAANLSRYYREDPTFPSHSDFGPIRSYLRKASAAMEAMNKHRVEADRLAEQYRGRA